MLALSLPIRPRTQVIAWAGLGLSCAVGLALAFLAASRPATTVADPARRPGPTTTAAATNSVRLSRAQQEAIGLSVAKAEPGQSRSVIVAPGRVTPDEGRYAHITSRAAGIVRSVAAQIGQDVKAGDLLATLDSPEVAQARFDLLTQTQALEVATTRADWQSAITAATLELIERLRAGDTPELIRARFDGRPVGENREKLLTAESQLRMTRAAMQRKKELLVTRAVSLAEFQVAEAEYEGALATYQSLLDRMGTEMKLADTRARQEKRQAETAIRVARGRLRALGVPADLESVPDAPPAAPAPGQPAPPTMSLYELRAPFDGTILDRESSFRACRSTRRTGSSSSRISPACGSRRTSTRGISTS